MSTAENKAVFLSYASQDAPAVECIAEALRAAGVEVWFDKNELVGGDAWDHKIRRQIKECALFVPVISAATQARREGYFRIEWKLAAQRTHAIADGTPFLLPVVVDGTRDADALVPEEFRAVQWTRLPQAVAAPKFVEQIKRLRAPLSVTEAGRPRSAARAEAGASPSKSRILLWTWAAVTVAAIATVAFFAARKSAPPPQAGAESRLPPAPAAPSSTTDPKSIAVLAFANLSADKDNEYFSDGLSENILDKLARVPGLRVMARTSSFSYKGRNVPIPQIGRELRVGTVIEGSVMRAGNQLRITAQLINAADGTHVWSEQFDRELTAANIFAMQDEIALKITGRLNPNATSATVAEARPTANLEAYDLYLRGQDLLAKNATESALQTAALLERATQLDPAFALAWARAGWARARYYSAGGIEAELQFEPASRDIAEALRLRPDLPMAHLARAILLMAEGNQLEAAGREIDLAEGGRPPTAESLWARGHWLLHRGQLTESVESFRGSMELDPRNNTAVNSYGISLMRLGRYAEAIAAYDQAWQMGGSSVSVSNKLGVILVWKGDAAEVLRLFNSIPDERWSSNARTALVPFLQGAGNYVAALANAQRIEPAEFLSQFQYFVRSALTARVREAMGDAEGAERDYRDALPRAEAFRSRHPELWRAYVTLAQIYTGLGRKEEALAAARKCLALLPPEKNPYLADPGLRALANALARFGQMDEALAIVHAQIEQGWWRRNTLLLLPAFSELQKDPRFRALAEKAPL